MASEVNAPTVDIDTLPAGREIEELVSELVFRGCARDDWSTDIMAAWQIVDHFQGKVALLGPDVWFAGMEYHNPATYWTVEIGPVMAFGETAPLALCRAALKAVW